MKQWFLEPGDVNAEGVFNLSLVWPIGLADEQQAEVDAGVYGPALQTMITAYQAEHSLCVDGRVGKETWARLTSA